MSVAALMTAIALDAFLGDPKWLPHPVRWMGRLISAAERIFYPEQRSASAEFIAGCITCATVIAVSAGCTVACLAVMQAAASIAAFIAESVIGFYCISAQSLVKEANRVRRLLSAGNLPEARRQLANIVGRDTYSLDEKDIIRATVETVAENITDGIISPLFYLAAGGPVAAIIFKAISTMDSMIGHKDDRYSNFGTCAARLDDALNFIPARMTGFMLIPLSAMITGLDWRNALRIVIRDRLKHPSPNSAHGEAAMAGALGVQLGGGAYYEGEFAPRPFLGNDERSPAIADIEKSTRIAWIATLIAALIALAALLAANKGWVL